MKQKIVKFLIIIILIFGLFGSAVFITALWVDDIDAKAESGYRSIYDQERVCQTSDYELKGWLDERMCKIICYTAGVDYGDSWLISCPKNYSDSVHAFVSQNELGEWTICNFAFNSIQEPSRIYCRICLYPIGTDWRVSGWMEEICLQTQN